MIINRVVLRLQLILPRVNLRTQSQRSLLLVLLQVGLQNRVVVVVVIIQAAVVQVMLLLRVVHPRRHVREELRLSTTRH